MFLTILIVIFSIIALMTLHEFGHFIVAKKFGLKVEEFGVGYPPRLFRKKIGETFYSLNLLPFGAFVKIPGEGGEKSSLEDYQMFVGKPAWQRSLVILGGVVSFWLIAAILLSIVFSVGTAVAISDQEQGPLTDPKVQILAISPDSPAEAAGLRAGDVIRQAAVDNSQFPINKILEVQDLTKDYGGKEIVLTIQRGSKTFDVSLVPRISHPSDEGPLGVALVRTAEKSYPWWQAPVKGVEATFNLTLAIVEGWWQIISNLVRGEGMPQGAILVGPVGVGSLFVQAFQVGIVYYIQFIAIIAVYLAIFNILPIPALDGGKLVFIGLEKLKGSPVNPRIEQNITAGFFVLIVCVMVWITIKDISRLF
jgi:regulator of sigma E protease